MHSFVQFQCVEDYALTQLNCTLPWKNGTKPVCSTPSNYKRYFEVAWRIRRYGEDGLETTTGCRPGCHRSEYSAK